MGGQVECHRQALLARGQVAAIERVGLGRGGEPGVLADGPRLVDVHRRIRPADIRRLTREAVQRVARRGDRIVTVGGDVDRFDVDALGCLPVELVGGVPVCGRGRADVFGDGGLSRRSAGALTVQRNVGEASDTSSGPVVAVISGPQSGEQV